MLWEPRTLAADGVAGQEGAMMDANQEYVLERWDGVIWLSDEERGTHLQVGGKEFGVKNSFGRTELYLTPDIKTQIWAAAAEYTRTREEEIRQLKEEIYMLAHGDCASSNNSAEEWREWAHTRAPRADQEYVIRVIRGHVISCRILARLGSALADLKRGMTVRP